MAPGLPHFSAVYTGDADAMPLGGEERRGGDKDKCAMGYWLSNGLSLMSLQLRAEDNVTSSCAL